MDKNFLLIVKKTYYYLISFLFYKPFVKKAYGKFIIISPILFDKGHFTIGKNVFIRNNARLEAIEIYGKVKYNAHIIINDGVSIEQNLHLTCAKKITIGSNTAIAANVSVTDIIHPYTDITLSPEMQQIVTKEVIIGSDCKIYNNTVILPGAVLGRHCIVGANSVVLGRTYPDYSLIIGAPAKIIKRYSFEKNDWCKTDPEGSFIY